MSKIWYAIGDFFERLFEVVQSIGNSINYFYIGIIFIFLVVWTIKMIQHKKNNEEHASS